MWDYPRDYSAFTFFLRQTIVLGFHVPLNGNVDEYQRPVDANRQIANAQNSLPDGDGRWMSRPRRRPAEEPIPQVPQTEKLISGRNRDEEIFNKEYDEVPWQFPLPVRHVTAVDRRRVISGQNVSCKIGHST